MSVDQRASFRLALSSQSEPHKQLQLRHTKEAQGQELKAQINALLSQQSSTVKQVTFFVDNINAQVAKIEKIEAHLRKMKENLQISNMELEKVMERDSLHSEEITYLEGELLIYESELKVYNQVIDT